MKKNKAYCLALLISICFILSIVLGRIDQSSASSSFLTAANGLDYIPLVFGSHKPSPTPSPTPQPGIGNWPMVAANPQRTSWTPDEVSGRSPNRMVPTD